MEAGPAAEGKWQPLLKAPNAGASPRDTIATVMARLNLINHQLGFDAAHTNGIDYNTCKEGGCNSRDP